MIIELRDFQAADVSRIREAYSRGVRRILYVLPTGGGKTTIFCHIARGAVNKGNRTGILVHRQELMRQSSRSLDFNGVAHGMIAPGHHQNKELAQIASVQTLARRLSDVLPFKFIIVDEAHHATAETWRKIFAAYPDALILGVTATPIRTNGAGLGDIFEEMIVGPSIKQLMDEGYLCKAKVFGPPPKFSLEDIKLRGGDYAKEELARCMDKPVIIGDAVAHYQRICPGQPAIGFCASISHAEHCAEKFRQAGFRFRALDGGMSDEYREESIRWLGEGKLDGLMSCDLISEGTDIPIVTVCIGQRPTQSTGLHMQMIGRVLRPIYAKGFDLKSRHGRLAAIAASQKPCAIVLDHVGNCAKHGEPDEEREWSLSAERRKKHRMPRYEEEEDLKIRQCPMCYNRHKVAKKCDNCGYEYPITPRTIEEREGTLVEITRRDLEGLLKDYKSLSEFLRIAKQNSYEDTWAHAKFKAQNERIREYKNTLNANATPITRVLVGGDDYPKPILSY